MDYKTWVGQERCWTTPNASYQTTRLRLSNSTIPPFDSCPTLVKMSKIPASLSDDFLFKPFSYSPSVKSSTVFKLSQ